MEIKQTPQFVEKGRKLIAAHSDFNDKLQEAGNSGLTLTPEATAEIVRLCAPEVAYWLAKEENFDVAHRLMDMDADRQIVEVRRIAQQLEASGFANDPDTEDWIKLHSPGPNVAWSVRVFLGPDSLIAVGPYVIFQLVRMTMWAIRTVREPK